MLTIGYCTRKTNQKQIDHLLETCGLDKNKIEIIEKINNGDKSLTKAYNEILNDAKYGKIVFCHDDIILENGWGRKILKHFEKNSDYGIIGVAGSKSLPKSGMWWENKKKMVGRVTHIHEGKTWLSKYSDHTGSDLDNVVIVDGLFFCIDKTKIKSPFNELVEGFHFYDINFCFDNYLAGVKIGVCSNIGISHLSIGMTNEKWEANRIQFSDRFKDELPVTLPRVLRQGEKLRVLIACLNFNNYTGSELYVFELAKQLTKDGCDVSICSTIGQPLEAAAKKLGIKLFSLQEPPGFKLGDGKWKLKTVEGEVLSQPNTLYKLHNISFDVVHLNHKPVTEHILRLYPDTPMISTIHSEVISLEEPVISPQIKKYIAIRPEIKEYIVDRFGVDEKSVDIIYNPIDSNKFKKITTTTSKTKTRVLFIGTIDYLRKNTIQDLVNTTKENNQELWIVGKKNDTYLDEIISGQNHVKYFEPTNNVEKYIHQCDIVAGVLLGRTTIEGWMCGKKAIIYDIDNQGNILSNNLHDIPDDIDKFKSNVIVKQIMEVYKSILD